MRLVKKISGRILSFYDNHLFLATSKAIYKCDSDALNPTLWFKPKVGFIYSILMHFYIFRRLFRLGFHHLAHSPNGAVIFVNGETWYHNNSEYWHAGPVRGSRPLNVCAADNKFFYGEYKNNAERETVSIFELAAPFTSWSKVLTLSGVRHIHGIFYDRYQDCFWITTGDLDHESKIYRCNKDFSNLHVVLSGSQQTRAITLLFQKDFVYFGSDTPEEKNYIYRLRRKDNSIKKLKEVGGSIFFGSITQNRIYFTTAVEPSKINKTKMVEVWSSEDGYQWSQVRRYQKDILSMRFFQYGQARIVTECYEKLDKLFIVPYATSIQEYSEMLEFENR